jgi:hypothetical protein
MLLNRHNQHQYRVGGSLNSDDPTYIIREADAKLYKALVRGEFCYVFNCSQMGKSSLRVKVQHRLQKEGFASISLDMTVFGSQKVSPETWYQSIAFILWRKFNLIEKVQFKTWWQQHQELSPLNQWLLFLSDVILSNIAAEKIFILIDEIDSVLNLNFPIDDFFAGIRYLYDARSENSDLNRLNFAVFGIATPAELIKDKIRTPFNIGTAIDLKGFTLSEVEPFIDSLANYCQTPETVVSEILAWTGGQPFLTQKVCKLTAQQTQDYPLLEEVSWIKKLVQTEILEHWESQDEPQHLKTIRDRLLKNDRTASYLLGLYRQILLHGFITVDASLEQQELLLTGLVIKQENKLIVSNQIYQSIFNLTWLDRQLDNLRPYAEALKSWLDSNCKNSYYLLSGNALKEAQAWADNHHLTQEEYQFLLASQTRETNLEKLKSNEAILQEKQKLGRCQRKCLVAIFGSALLGTLSLTSIFYQQYSHAHTNPDKNQISTNHDLVISH